MRHETGHTSGAAQRPFDGVRDKGHGALLRLFSTTAGVTYACSERGEKATGPTELRRMLSDLLARPQTYSFEFISARLRGVALSG
jgi:hypothetical protein